MSSDKKNTERSSKLVASIKGFSITNYRDFETNDGVAFDCNLRYQGKIVGNASNEGYGGPTEYHFQKKEMESIFLESVKSYYKEFPLDFGNYESFIEELLQLNESLAAYKKALKTRKYTAVAKVEFMRRVNSDLYSYKPSQMYLLEKNTPQNIEALLKRTGGLQCTVYSKPEDFIID